MGASAPPEAASEGRVVRRKLLVFVVYVALFIDNLLLTAVVPIMPEYLMRLQMTDEAGNSTENAPITVNETSDGEQEVPASVQQTVGLMFGSKALVQLITNPVVGSLTGRIGYTAPMFTGFGVIFFSTLLFAFGSQLWMLWVARALQGVGSACTSTAGMGMIAAAYPDDKERGAAMGIALGGLALGLLFGAPYGGAMYSVDGWYLPFVIIAALTLANGLLQYIVLRPGPATMASETRTKTGSSEEQSGDASGEAVGGHGGLAALLKDPLVLVCAGAIMIGNLCMGILEPSLPLYMMRRWNSSALERGLAFLPASGSYLIGTSVFGPLGARLGRWTCTMAGLLLVGVSLVATPLMPHVYALAAPMFALGFAIGMIDSSMFPEMGRVVDVRHAKAAYGGVYAIADAAFCSAFCLGPFLSGTLIGTFGFQTTLALVASLTFLYAPMLLLLRSVRPRRRVTSARAHAHETAVQADSTLSNRGSTRGKVHPADSDL